MTSWPSMFQPEIESNKPDLARRLSLLKAQLNRVYSGTSFYHDKFDAAGFKPDAFKSLDDFRHAPLTTKVEVRDSQQAQPPLGRHALADISAVQRLHVTSGTTGRPVFVGLTHNDHETNSIIGARAFWAAGIRPDDIVLHCLNYSFYAGGIADHMCIERTGAAVVPVGIGQSRRLLEIAPDIRPTAMFAITSYPFYLAEVAEKQGVDPRSVGLRTMVVGGEPGGSLPETQAQIRNLWGASSVCDTYGLSEVLSTFAAQCEYHEGLHYCADDVLYPELLDPESGEPLPIETGVEGVLTFTHLVKEANPMIRFRTGDMARVMGTSCPCGRTGFRFRVIGRADDMFIVRGVNVFPSAVEAIVRKQTPQTTGEFCILLESEIPQPPLKILVESAVPDQGAAWAELSAALEDAIRRDLQFTASVKLLPAGSLTASEHKTPRLFRLYRGDKPPVEW